MSQNQKIRQWNRNDITNTIQRTFLFGMLPRYRRYNENYQQLYFEKLRKDRNLNFFLGIEMAIYFPEILPSTQKEGWKFFIKCWGSSEVFRKNIPSFLQRLDLLESNSDERAGAVISGEFFKLSFADGFLLGIYFLKNPKIAPKYIKFLWGFGQFTTSLRELNFILTCSTIQKQARKDLGINDEEEVL